MITTKLLTEKTRLVFSRWIFFFFVRQPLAFGFLYIAFQSYYYTFIKLYMTHTDIVIHTVYRQILFYM